MASKHLRQHNWIWLVPLLLLLTALSLPLSDADSLWYDEVWSLKNAGGAIYGPLSPIGIWEQVTQVDPHQALGYPYLLALWGAFTGWSELAGRHLSLLAGLLSICVTYRIGREGHSVQMGLFAALILGLSGFFIYYTHELRTFTLVALFAAVLLWSYRRLLQHQRFGRLSAVFFVLGAAGLLYTHYFAAATLLAALGLHHLLFVKKDQRWWHITGLAVIVTLIFLPELPGFLLGYTRYAPGDPAEAPLTTPALIMSLAAYVGNNTLLVWLVLLAGFVALWQMPRLRFLLSMTLFSLVMTVIANELLGILEPRRIRYVIVLWPLLALWASAGIVLMLERLPRRRMLSVLLAGLWLGNALLQHNGAWIDPLRAEDVLRWRSMTQIMGEYASPDDLFAYYGGTGQQAYDVRLGFEYSTDPLPFPSLVTSTLYEGASRDWALAQVAAAQRIWYGVDRRNPLNDYHESFEQELSKLFITCRTFLETPEMSLQLYAKSPIFCEQGARVYPFADAFALRVPYIAERTDDEIVIQLAWRIMADVPPNTYNVALHLVAQGERSPLVQQDIPLANTPTALVDVRLSLANIPAGDYALDLLVYNWRSGERLTLNTGEERLTLTTLSLP